MLASVLSIMHITKSFNPDLTYNAVVSYDQSDSKSCGKNTIKKTSETITFQIWRASPIIKLFYNFREVYAGFMKFQILRVFSSTYSGPLRSFEYFGNHARSFTSVLSFRCKIVRNPVNECFIR